MFIEDTPSPKDQPQQKNAGDSQSTGVTPEDGPKHAPRHSVPRKLKGRTFVPSHLRPRSVRAKIVALLMVPVVSLMALWAFATVTTAQSVSGIQRYQDVNETLLAPVNDLVHAVQEERNAASRYLAAPDSAREETLDTTGRSTEVTYDAVRAGVSSSTTEIAALDAELPERLTSLTEAASGLEELRAAVLAGDIGWSDAFEAYTGVIESGFAVSGGLAKLQPEEAIGTDASDPRVLLELFRAREMFEREDAVIGAAFAAGELYADQYAMFVGFVHSQRELFDSAVPDLRPADATEYRKVLDGDAYTSLRELETQVQQVGSGTAVVGELSDDAWRNTADDVRSDLARAEETATIEAAAKANPFSLEVLGGSGLAVVLGFIGVILSLVISVQIGRGLVIDLVALRNSAMDLAGHKLPAALKKLHTGDEIDVDAEAPFAKQAGDEGEVAQVAEALNAVHRSAIRSAIERAEALSGISAVYVYLARRSQVLLHRQLALLDTMERRIDDPDELEDLFRLDHLTTRMRRLAESLIILSGAAPARGWRKPVPLMDTVRAAVAEVEDFTRVDIHDLPELRIVGASVADVTHLLAELIENAVVFSPPHTQAHLRGELVGSGLAIEIEDRGLGMSPQALEEANRRIDDAEQVDLLETDQLGLFVVNRLAHRHNIRVTLQASPYGGITAVVLIPEALIDRSADGDVGVDSPLTRLASSHGATPGGASRARALPPARVAAPVPPPDPHMPSGGGLGPGVPPWTPSEKPLASSETPTGWFVATPGAVVDGNGNGREADHEPEPDAGAQETPVHGGPATPASGPTRLEPEAMAPLPSTSPHSDGMEANVDTTEEGLPKRRRQASLSPQLREPTIPPDEDSTPAEPADVRSPDEARATMAAMRSGWLRGNTDSGSPETDEPVKGESGQSHGEGK